MKAAIIAVVSAILMLVLLLGGGFYVWLLKTNALYASLTLEEKVYVAATPTVKVGIERNYPPFIFMQDGKPNGVCQNALDLISARTRLTFAPGQVNDLYYLLEAAKHGTIDIIPSIAKNQEREKFLNFTDPYISVSTAIFKRNNVPPGRIGVGKGYAVEEWLRANHSALQNRLLVNDLEIVTFLNDEEALTAMLNGKIDGVVMDEASFNYLYAKNNLSIRTFRDDLSFTYDIAIGVVKGNATLFNILQKAVKSLTAAEKRLFINIPAR